MANSWASDVVVLPVLKDFSMVIVLPISMTATVSRWASVSVENGVETLV